MPRPTSPLMRIGYVGAGLLAGAALATTITAHAASPTPTPTTTGSTSTTGTTTTDPHPGDNGADGVPESQEVHSGGHRGALDLSGTVTAVSPSSVTIKTASGTTEYWVTSTSDIDIDKNGEAALSNLAAGDVVTFSVDTANANQIDKLHAGDESKDAPRPSAGSSANPSGAA